VRASAPVMGSLLSEASAEAPNQDGRWLEKLCLSLSFASNRLHRCLNDHCLRERPLGPAFRPRLHGPVLSTACSKSVSGAASSARRSQTCQKTVVREPSATTSFIRPRLTGRQIGEAHKYSRWLLAAIVQSLAMTVADAQVSGRFDRKPLRGRVGSWPCAFIRRGQELKV
jgi:hypothetical protein